MLYRNLPDDRLSLSVTLAVHPDLQGPLLGLGANYITRTTFQGDGLGPTIGVWADESVYIESASLRPLVMPATPALCSSLSHALELQRVVSIALFEDAHGTASDADGRGCQRGLEMPRSFHNICSQGVNVQTPQEGGGNAADWSGQSPEACVPSSANAR